MMGRVRFELTTTDSQNQRKIFAVRILMAVPQRIELWSSDRQSDIISTIRWNHAQRLFSLGASPSMPTLCDEVGDYLPTFSRLCAHCGKDIKLLVSFPLVFRHKIDYCELAVYQRDTFLYWVMYPVHTALFL